MWNVSISKGPRAPLKYRKDVTAALILYNSLFKMNMMNQI